MSKEFFVLRGSKVVYAPGHYDLEGAQATAKRTSQMYPRAVVRVVQEIEAYSGPWDAHNDEHKGSI